MNKTTRRLAVFAALLATFEATHGICDQLVQNSDDARNKRATGDHLVYADGTPVDEAPERAGEPTMTADQLALIAVRRHVASYTAVQTLTAAAVTRSLGLKVGPAAYLAGALINGLTHGAIDRGPLFRAIVKAAGKDGYLEHCQAVRLNKDSGQPEEQITGPGTAWMEIDEYLHRYIGVSAAVVMTLIATRKDA